MVGIIYVITNIKNNKKYVGQTINSLEKRWKKHLSKTTNCVALQNAIKKYGKNNFKIEIEEEIEDNNKKVLIEKLNCLEKIYIFKYNSLAPDGYNLTLGGDVSSITKESIVKRSEKHKIPIICNQTGQIFASIKEAGEFYGTKAKFIHRVLRGHRKHWRKMSFSYLYPEMAKPISKEDNLNKRD